MLIKCRNDNPNPVAIFLCYLSKNTIMSPMISMGYHFDKEDRYAIVP